MRPERPHDRHNDPCPRDLRRGRCPLHRGQPADADRRALPTVDLSDYDANGDSIVTLRELECNQIYIGTLSECGVEYDLNYKFTLMNRLDGGYIDPAGQVVYDPDWKFIHWPTNLYMGDRVMFDVLYELWSGDPTTGIMPEDED